MLKKAILLGAGLTLATAATMMGGCSSAATAPELMTTAKTPGQYNNQLSRVINNNTRGIWNDADRLFFLDKNQNLQPFVAP